MTAEIDNAPKNPVLPSIDHYQQIVDRAHTEIAGVRNEYKWLLEAIGIIASVFLICGGIFFYRSINEMKSDVKKDIENLNVKYKESLDLLVGKLQIDLNKMTDSVKNEVRNRVNNELDKENINKIIENETKLRTENFTRKYIESQKLIFTMQLDSQLNISREAISNEVKILISNANETVNNFKKYSQFTMKVISAQNGDRASWDTLKTIANDNKSEFNKQADMAYETIKDQYSQPQLLEQMIMPFPWDKNDDTSNISMNNLDAIYSQISDAGNYLLRISLINFIWDRKYINKIDKLDFLMKVIQQDNNLHVVRHAGFLFTTATNLQIKSLAVNYFINFWKDHRVQYINNK